jgi:hypothetical protein
MRAKNRDFDYFANSHGHGKCRGAPWRAAACWRRVLAESRVIAGEGVI